MLAAQTSLWLTLIRSPVIINQQATGIIGVRVKCQSKPADQAPFAPWDFTLSAIRVRVKSQSKPADHGPFAPWHLTPTPNIVTPTPNITNSYTS